MSWSSSPHIRQDDARLNPCVAHVNSYYFTNTLHGVLAAKLQNSGLRQHVFVALQKGTPVTVPVIPNTSFTVNECFSKWDRRMWPIKMIKVWNAYRRDGRHHGADVNHAHSLIVNGVVALLARRRFGIPYVVTVRNSDVNHFLARHAVFRRLGQCIMNNAVAVTTLSPAYWDVQLNRLYGPDRLRMLDGRHHVIPNGCDDFWLANRYGPKHVDGPLRLLFVGLLKRNKNLSTLIEVCKRLRCEGVDYRLDVVGEGALRPRFEEQARELPVSFHGYVADPHELLQHYRNSHVLVVPSLTESFGLVYVEAMTQGCPVIYTASQGFDGFMPNGDVGYAVDPLSVAQIADRIVAIRDDYPRFSSAALAACERFSWEGSVTALRRLYVSAAQENAQAV